MSKHGTSIEYVATLDHCRYLKSYNPCYPLTKDKTHVSHDHTVRCLCAWLCLYMSRSMIDPMIKIDLMTISVLYLCVTLKATVGADSCFPRSRLRPGRVRVTGWGP